MHYIVLDLEWNIPSRRQRNSSTDKAVLPEEIMEIGACKLDENLEILDKFDTDVKAKYNLKLDNHVAKVTHRTTQSLQQGLYFPQAVAEFRDWCYTGEEDKILFCVWSNNDLKPWSRNLEINNISWSEGLRFFDVQRLYALAFSRKNRQTSVETAIKEQGIALTLPLHRAVNDAWYTALILQKLIKLLQEKAVLPKSSSELFDLLYKYSFDLNFNYKDKFRLPDISDITEFQEVVKNYNWRCPACARTLSIQQEWTALKAGQKLTNMSFCPEHGNIFIKAYCYQNPQANCQKNFAAKAVVKINWFSDAKLDNSPNSYQLRY